MLVVIVILIPALCGSGMYIDIEIGSDNGIDSVRAISIASDIGSEGAGDIDIVGVALQRSC